MSATSVAIPLELRTLIYAQIVSTVRVETPLLYIAEVESKNHALFSPSESLSIGLKSKFYRHC